MSMIKEREQRQSVRLSVRYKTDDGWSDAQIHNLSSSGMMAVCADPPGRGTYIELRRGDFIVVGRVVWSCGDRFGLRSQDRINVGSLTQSAPQSAKSNEERRKNDRIREKLVVNRTNAEESAVASVLLARLSQFLVFAVVGGAAVLIIADWAYDAISDPLDTAQVAFRQSRH